MPPIPRAKHTLQAIAPSLCDANSNMSMSYASLEALARTPRPTVFDYGDHSQGLRIEMHLVPAETRIDELSFF